MEKVVSFDLKDAETFDTSDNKRFLIVGGCISARGSAFAMQTDPLPFDTSPPLWYTLTCLMALFSASILTSVESVFVSPPLTSFLGVY